MVGILLILAGWWALPAPPEVRLVATKGEQNIYELPDGSVATLNAQSSISYEPGEWSSARRVELNGEAFFEVKKGTPFLVKTPYGDVQVLGTSFNVDARKDHFSVACFTGSVRVVAASRSQVLSPGERVFVSDNVLKMGVFEGDKEAAWRVVNDLVLVNEYVTDKEWHLPTIPEILNRNLRCVKLLEIQHFVYQYQNFVNIK